MWELLERPGGAPEVGWDELLELDRRHVWHPYGPMPAAYAALPVESAQGVRLRLADGRELAIEVAIKTALQVAGPGRPRLLTVRGGYHGDTFGAMAVCDPVGGMHARFAGALTENVFAPRPPDGFDAPPDQEWAAEVTRLAERHAHELAAIIAEVWLRPFGDLIYTMPPYVTGGEDLERITGAIVRAAAR